MSCIVHVALGLELVNLLVAFLLGSPFECLRTAQPSYLKQKK